MLTLINFKQKIKYQTFNQPEPNFQNHSGTNNKNSCGFCPYQSKCKWVVERHTEKKHYHYEHSHREAD